MTLSEKPPFNDNERPKGYRTQLDTSSVIWRDFFVNALDHLLAEIQTKRGIKGISKKTIQDFRKNSGGFVLNMSCRHPEIRREALDKIEKMREILAKIDNENDLKIEFLKILQAHEDKLLEPENE